MNTPIFRDSWTPPTRWFRLKNGVAGFILHPLVKAAVVTFWAVVIVTVIVVAVTKGWLL